MKRHYAMNGKQVICTMLMESSRTISIGSTGVTAALPRLAATFFSPGMRVKKRGEGRIGLDAGMRAGRDSTRGLRTREASLGGKGERRKWTGDDGCDGESERNVEVECRDQ